MNNMDNKKTKWIIILILLKPQIYFLNIFIDFFPSFSIYFLLFFSLLALLLQYCNDL